MIFSEFAKLLFLRDGVCISLRGYLIFKFQKQIMRTHISFISTVAVVALHLAIMLSCSENYDN